VFAQPLRPSLDTLVRNLDRDPVRSKRLIRQFVDEDQAAFLRSAIQLLAADTDSRGARHIVAVIVEAGLLLPALYNPLLTRERALALAQAAASIDPTIDVALARTLADDVSAAQSSGEFDQHARLMEILAAISDGVRIFPSLVRLLRHTNPHIRSKAVLMIGRGNRSAKWVRQRLADTDPRIRANAAEALWGVDTEEARELLQSLVRDCNNRVAGNAILGLYRLGDCSMVQEIIALARHESAMFRATAAWIVGETGDPRFTETVAGLLRESNTVVRKRAFAALGSLRASVAQAVNGPRWRLSARLLDSDPAKRRILLGVVAGPKLLATQISVSEDGVPVVRYRVADRPLPETMSVVFIAPRSAPLPTFQCLKWKRASDLWTTLHYVREMSSPPPAYVSLRFQSNPEEDRVPPAADCLDVWHSLMLAVTPESGSVAGKRHVILFSNAHDRPSPGDMVRAAVIAGQAFVQVISSAPDPTLEEFCRAVGGVFRLDSEDALVESYLALFGRYEISYQAVNPDARVLKIRTHGPGMSAETTVTTSSPTPAES
jgi:HEAT repeat protein